MIPKLTDNSAVSVTTLIRPFSLACDVLQGGVPVTTNTIAQVQTDSVAQKAGLKANDTIIAIDGRLKPCNIDAKAFPSCFITYQVWVKP